MVLPAAICTNNHDRHLREAIIRLMYRRQTTCSLIIIHHFFSFVKMPKSTIFLLKVCLKKRNWENRKKVKKTLDKQRKECYNTTEVERNFKIKQNFRSHHATRKCVWLIHFPLSRGVLCAYGDSLYAFFHFLEVYDH